MMKSVVKIILFSLFILQISCASNSEICGEYKYNYYPGVGYLNLKPDNSFEYKMYDDLVSDSFYGYWKKRLNMVVLFDTSHFFESGMFETEFKVRYDRIDTLNGKIIQINHQGEPLVASVVKLNDSIKVLPDTTGICKIENNIQIDKVVVTCIGCYENLEFKVREKNYNYITVNVLSNLYVSNGLYLPEKTRWLYRKGKLRQGKTVAKYEKIN